MGGQKFAKKRVFTLSAGNKCILYALNSSSLQETNVNKQSKNTKKPSL